MNCNDLWKEWKRDRYIDPVSGSNGVAEIQNVDVAYIKEKTLKKLEKEVDFSMGICYYNTCLERQGETY